MSTHEQQTVTDNILIDKITELSRLMHRHHLHESRFFGSPGNRFRGQGRVLAILNLQQVMGQKELGFMLGMSKQGLAELLSKLEAKGYITRTVSESDRRAVVVTLTDVGAAMAATMHPAKEATHPLFADFSPEELEQLNVLLDKLIDNLRHSFHDELHDEFRDEFRDGFRDADPWEGRGRGHRDRTREHMGDHPREHRGRMHELHDEHIRMARQRGHHHEGKHPAHETGGKLPIWDAERCVFCKKCQKTCLSGAIEVEAKAREWLLIPAHCTSCGRCVSACPEKALRMADYQPAEHEEQ